MIDGILDRADIRARVLGELADLGKDLTARAFVRAIVTKSWRGMSRDLAALSATCLDRAWDEAALDCIDALWLCWAEGRGDQMLRTFEAICDRCGVAAANDFRAEMARRN